VQCFAGALYEQRQHFDLAAGAGLVLIDWIVSGRHARGERWAFTRYHSRTEIVCDEEKVLVDSVLLDPADGPLAGSYRMGRFDCVALLLLVGEPVRLHAEAMLAGIAAKPISRQAAVQFAASP